MTLPIYALTNTDYFFLYSHACNVGAFDTDDCFAEELTTTEHAAFAAVLNSRTGWQGWGNSQRFNRHFWDAVLGEGIMELGWANQDSKEECIGAISDSYPAVRYCYYELTVFGDPEQRFVFGQARDSAWVAADTESGTVGDHNSTVIDVNFSGEILPAGAYEGMLFVSSSDPAKPVSTVSVTMTVLQENPVVTPYDSFEAIRMEEDDSFLPECFTYTLGNDGPNSVNWTASDTKGWVDIEPNSGTLDANDTVDVNVCVNSTAYQLGLGCHCDFITFTNTTDSNISHERAILLTYMNSNVVYNLNNSKHYYAIQEAMDDADDGDELVVCEGTYHEEINFEGKAITLRSHDPGSCDVVSSTVIACPEGKPAYTGVKFNHSEGSDSVLRGFTICGGTSGTGVDCYGASPVIERCIIKGNASGILLLFGASATVRNNWICDNDEGIRLFLTSSVATMRNNTIVHNINAGIYLDSGTAPAISNCIIWDCNDDLYGCTATYSCIQDGDAGTGNINSDPCFVDDANGDYHLDANSLCKDAGDPNGDYSGETDIDGQLRAMGDCNEIVDMGADEVFYPNCWNCASQCYGDTDCDGDVDIVDWPALRDSFGYSYPHPYYNPCADFDREGTVSLADFQTFNANFNDPNLPTDCNCGGIWPPE
jgi:hypothetical protein